MPAPAPVLTVMSAGRPMLPRASMYAPPRRNARLEVRPERFRSVPPALHRAAALPDDPQSGIIFSSQGFQSGRFHDPEPVLAFAIARELHALQRARVRVGVQLNQRDLLDSLDAEGRQIDREPLAHGLAPIHIRPHLPAV